MSLKTFDYRISELTNAAPPTSHIKEIRLIAVLSEMFNYASIDEWVEKTEFVRDMVKYTLRGGALDLLYGELIPKFIAYCKLPDQSLSTALSLLDPLLSFRNPGEALDYYLDGRIRYLTELSEHLGSRSGFVNGLCGLCKTPLTTESTMLLAEKPPVTKLTIIEETKEAFLEWLTDQDQESEEFLERSWYTPSMGRNIKANYGDFDVFYAFLYHRSGTKHDRFVFDPTLQSGLTDYLKRTETLDNRYKELDSKTPYGFWVFREHSNHYIRFFNHAGVELTGDYFDQAHALRSIYERFTGQSQPFQTMEWAKNWTDEESSLLNLTRSTKDLLIAPTGFFYADL